MAAFTANGAPPKFGGHTSFRNLQVAASEWIYRGAAVGVNPAGYAKEFAPGDKLIGFAEHEFKADTAAGDKSIRGDQTEPGQPTIRVTNYADLVHLTVASAARKDIGRYVYATDDGTFAFAGHPDAIVGRVVQYDTSGEVICEMRNIGNRPPNAIGSIDLTLTGYETIEATGAVAGDEMVQAFEFETILGLGTVQPTDAEDGGHKLGFDATAEVALASVRMPNDILPVDEGLTFEVDLVVSDKGDAAALDIDFGFGTALTTNSEADIDHADMVNLALFHLDGNSDNILAQSDNNTTDVASVDTTIDNDSTTDVPKRFKIIVRKGGGVEFWIDGARVLTTTTFAVASTANLAAFVNMEKTSDDTTAEIIFRNLRVAAAGAA